MSKDLDAQAGQWLGRFERALSAGDTAALSDLFEADSHWRDVLALTWRIATVSGREAIVRGLAAEGGRAPPSGFAVDAARTPPRG